MDSAPSVLNKQNNTFFTGIYLQLFLKTPPGVVIQKNENNIQHEITYQKMSHILLQPVSPQESSENKSKSTQ